MRGCLECATLYERDLVGQADHAPESPRPRRRARCAGVCRGFVQTRSGRSGGSRAEIVTTAAVYAMFGVCRGGTNAIWSVRRITCRNRHDHARSHVLGLALTLGVTAWRTQAVRGTALPAIRAAR